MATRIFPRFATVVSAKVVYVPFEVKAKDGGEDTKFARMGVRVNMADGSWWFHHYKRGSWTQHYPLIAKTYPWGGTITDPRTGKPEYLPERKNSYEGFVDVLKEFGQRSPFLPQALLAGVDIAEEEDAEKRMGG